jgi:hypothetical protein
MNPNAILLSSEAFDYFMSSRLRIINIVAARPNLPKIAPLIREMQRHPEIDAIHGPRNPAPNMPSAIRVLHR